MDAYTRNAGGGCTGGILQWQTRAKFEMVLLRVVSRAFGHIGIFVEKGDCVIKFTTKRVSAHIDHEGAEFVMPCTILNIQL